MQLNDSMAAIEAVRDKYPEDIGAHGFLSAITSIKHEGIVHDEFGREFYEKTEFVLRGTKFTIKFAENPVVEYHIFGEDRTPMLTVAHGKDNNHSGRVNINFQRRSSSQTHNKFIMPRELCYFLLLKTGAIATYLSGNYELNHMSAELQPLADYMEVEKLYKRYAKIREVECDRDLTDEELNFLYACNYSPEEKFRNLRKQSHGLSMYPERIRNNKLSNLELCTKAENLAHKSLFTDANDWFHGVFEARKLRIPAEYGIKYLECRTRENAWSLLKPLAGL